MRAPKQHSNREPSIEDLAAALDAARSELERIGDIIVRPVRKPVRLAKPKLRAYRLVLNALENSPEPLAVMEVVRAIEAAHEVHISKATVKSVLRDSKHARAGGRDRSGARKTFRCPEDDTDAIGSVTASQRRSEESETGCSLPCVGSYDAILTTPA